MDASAEALKRLLPEMAALLTKRYSVLKTVQSEGPVGRRPLAELLNMSERELRKETDLLRDQQLLTVRTEGMVISSEGEEVLGQLSELYHDWSGLPALERRLETALGIAKVIVVPKDSDELPAAKIQLAKEAARFLEKQFPVHKRIAVTGGSTMALIADELKPEKPDRALEFIAARGGLGEDALHQANTIASSFAKKTGGMCRTFYLPDRLSPEAYATMMKEPFIEEMTALYDTADVVVHGIGSAEEMAVRRRSSPEEMERIRGGGAAGEAFGYYFDEAGQVVYRIRTAGIQLEQLKNAPAILAVAGGRSKAKAILSYLKNAPAQTVLITDEGAAVQMVKYSEETGGTEHDFKISD